jgi:RNA polymerase sigma-70 factor (ECF subfamily)
MDSNQPSNMTDSDDAALMALVRDDHREAFTVLVRRHQKTVLNFFTRYGVQVCDAEDLAQQTFLRLYRYRARYKPSAKLTTFLFLLARQVWIDELRRRQRAARMVQALANEPQPEYRPWPVDKTPHADANLSGALAKLPEGLRLVVELGVYQELPYAEVARALRIPVGTVKSRMFHALRALRRMLEGS